MNNPSYQQCLSHLEDGGEVWAERDSDDDYDVYESLDSFLETWDNNEDYDYDAREGEFLLK